MTIDHRVTAIVACNNLDASTAFYARLGLAVASDYGAYRILSDGKGWHLHLAHAPEGWVMPERNPFGLYLYTRDVDALAAACGDAIIEAGKKPEHKHWGMYEFAVSDPDGTLVRIGWPSGELG